MQRLIITGASGFLGAAIGRRARNSFETWGTCNTHSALPDGITPLPIDLTNTTALERTLQQIRPDIIIHAAAASLPDVCQNDPAASYAINVDVTAHLARLCHMYGIRLVFASTDMVFEGVHAPYKESDVIGPINIYGHQKLAAERATAYWLASALICRLPLLYGDSWGRTPANFLTSIAQNLRNQRPTTLFNDQYRTPASTDSVARGLITLAQTSASGILHFGGPERLSRFDFGLRLAKFLQADESLILGNSQANATFIAPRPRDVSLDSSAAYALGYDPQTLETEFARSEDLKNI